MEGVDRRELEEGVAVVNVPVAKGGTGEVVAREGETEGDALEDFGGVGAESVIGVDCSDCCC